MCLGSSQAKQDAARIDATPKMSIEHWGDSVNQPMLPYSDKAETYRPGVYMGIDRAKTPGYPVDTLPTVKVFRPIAPPLPQATVTLTLTEAQARHLKLLLGTIGNNDGKPAVIGWNTNDKPGTAIVRESTDAIYYALSAAKI